MRLGWLGKRREHPRPPIRPVRLAARAIVVTFLQTFKEFPTRQKAASFTHGGCRRERKIIGK